jgi:Glycosyltransferase
MIENSTHNSYDILCLSHLRWDFVYQRPQHLLSRFARQQRVFFFEEPIFSDEPSRLDISRREDKLTVAVPRLKHGENVNETLRKMIGELRERERINEFVLWYYTPMALDFTEELAPLATVFDCMDELSAFKFAPPALVENERRLMQRADVVFTGGQSLYEAKKDRHSNIHAFPSSIDAKHFNQARTITDEPADQKNIPHPRIGFCGVIDERMDIELLGRMADLRPEWQFVMIGPVVKISEEDLPRRANIHYLGGKNYKELPAYIAGWDVAMMPFALNESTRYISPTKTPEYLAAGKPVVSTPIRDVVRPYGEIGLVYIAATAEEFVAACEKAMREDASVRLQKTDEFLSHNSWDKTFERMKKLIDECVEKNSKPAAAAA